MTCRAVPARGPTAGNCCSTLTRSPVPSPPPSPCCCGARPATSATWTKGSTRYNRITPTRVSQAGWRGGRHWWPRWAFTSCRASRTPNRSKQPMADVEQLAEEVISKMDEVGADLSPADYAELCEEVAQRARTCAEAARADAERN